MARCLTVAGGGHRAVQLAYADRRSIADRSRLEARRSHHQLRQRRHRREHAYVTDAVAGLQRDERQGDVGDPEREREGHDRRGGGYAVASRRWMRAGVVQEQGRPGSVL